MQQYSQLVYDLPAERRSIDDFSNALALLEEAKSVFAELAARKEPAQKLGFDPNIANERLKHCDYIKFHTTRRLVQLKANEEIKQERLEELKRKRDDDALSQQHQREIDDKQLLEREEKLRAQREQLYVDLQEQMKEVQSKSVIQPEVKVTFLIFALMR
jgi:hypothetical protein